MLSKNFFNQEACTLAKALLGKVIYVKHILKLNGLKDEEIWLTAYIIETEAYYKNDKASHSSLGYTEKRKALFMPPGTIYMYYARGKDSLNISAQGEGNAVLIKSGFPYIDQNTHSQMINIMQELNPANPNLEIRPIHKLCAGQTLLCKSLGLKVKEWDQKMFDHQSFFIKDIGYEPKQILETTRLGIPKGRDEHLPYRFIDASYAKYCSKKLITNLNPT